MKEESKFRRFLLKLTVLSVSVLTIMSAATIAPVLPSLAKEFSTVPYAPFLSKLMLSLPALFIALSAPLAGRFIDQHGRLKLLYFGLILYAMAGTSGYFLDNIYYILGGRILLGCAIGITMTVGVTLIGDYFQGEQRKRFVGFQGAVIAFGGVIFTQVGGILADIGWQIPFLIYLLSLLFIPMVLVFLKEPDIGHQDSVHTQAEHQTPAGLLHKLYGTAILFMILFYIIPTQLPFHLNKIGVNQYSIIGTALAINSLGAVIGSLMYARVKRRIDFPHVFFIGFLLMAIGFFGVGVTTNVIITFGFVFAAGIGFGLILPNLNFWIIEITKAEVRGHNIGVLTTCIFLGQFISPIISEPLITLFDVSAIFPLAGGCLGLLSLAFAMAKLRTKNVTNY